MPHSGAKLQHAGDSCYLPCSMDCIVCTMSNGAALRRLCVYVSMIL